MQNYGFTMHQLLEAGVHFGHQTRRWNPRMAPYLFGERNGIHIVDLEQTVPLLQRALDTVRDVAAEGGRVLFVGTKRQASSLVAESANRCGQPYVNHRWLGGTLTNLRVVTSSVGKLRALGEKLESDNIGLTKRELLKIRRMHAKLERSLGGVQNMAGLPDILFVIDVNKDHIALSEATKLAIPVVAVIDSNSNPEGVTYPIPGNDDSTSAIRLYCELVSLAILSGLRQEAERKGLDVETDGMTEERKLEDESRDDASPSGKPAGDFGDEQSQGEKTVVE